MASAKDLTFEPARFETTEDAWPRVDIKEGEIYLSGRYRPADLALSIVRWFMLFCVIVVGLSWVGFHYTRTAGLAAIAFYGLIGFIPITLTVFGIGKLFRSSLDIRVTPEMIQVRRAFGRTENYRMADIREIGFDEHQKAKESRRRIEARTGQARVDENYRGAYEAVIRYGRRRVALASFRFEDFEKGAALVRVLQDAHAAVTGVQSPRTSGRSGAIDVEADLR